MPMVVLNMGAEMLYILNQRLHAQKIAEAKRNKVLVDVTKTMFAEHFVSALFNEQYIYSPTDVRKIFDRLAHSSIMRLNAKSMSKLYDLMIMGFKRQILSTTQPAELIAILLNHLESVEDLVHGAPEAELVRTAMFRSKQFYGALSVAELFDLRATLLDFYQDSKIRISILLRNETQLSNGQMVINATGPVPQHTSIPGKVHYFKPGGELDRVESVAVIDADKHTEATPSDLMSRGRLCKLGLNIYHEKSDKKDGDAAASKDAETKQDGTPGSGPTPTEGAANEGSSGAGDAPKEPDNDAAADGDDDLRPVHKRTQLIDLLDRSRPSADIALTFNDFFGMEYPTDGQPGDGGLPEGEASSGRSAMSIDRSNQATATKAALEQKLGLDEKKSGGEGKVSESKDDDDDGDDLLAMMDSTAT